MIPTRGDNINLARRAFAEWKAGEPFGTRGSYGLVHPSIVKNLERAANDIPLSGPKINPFASALRGDPDAVVVDRHINHAFGFANDTPTARQRAAVGRGIRAGAKRHGLTNRQFQAAVWEGELRRRELFSNPAEEIGRASDVFPGGLPKGFRPNVAETLEARVGRFKSIQEFLDAAVAGISATAIATRDKRGSER